MRIDRLILRHGDLTRGQRRPADAAQVEVELEVPLRRRAPCATARAASSSCDVPLAVVDGQRVQREAVAPGDRRRGVGIQAAAEQDDGALRYPGSQIPTRVRLRACRESRCTCAAAAAGGRSRSASTHSDSCFGSSTPWTGENSTACTRVGQVARAARSSRRELVVRAIGDHELHLVVRSSRCARLLQSFLSASPLPGHFTSMIRITPAGTCGDAAMAAGLEQHGLARLEQALHQRIHVLLQQRLAAGDLDERAAVRLDLGHHLVHAHLAAFVERVRRVAPAAAQVAGGQADEHARPAGVGRLALNRVEDLVDRSASVAKSSLMVDPACYSRMLAHRHVRLELPHRQGHVERHLLPAARGPRARVRRAALLRRALQHRRGQHHVLRPAARRTSTLGWAKRTPPGFEFSVKLYQKFTHPQHGDRSRPGHRRPTSTSSRAASSRWPPPASSGRCWRSSRRAFTTRRKRVDYLAWLLQTFAGYPLAVELRHRTWSDAPRHRSRCSTRFGAAWVQIDEPKFRFVDPPGSTWPDTARRSTTCACTAGTPRSGGTTTESEDRYNYLYSADELQPIADKVRDVLATARTRRPIVKKAYLYRTTTSPRSRSPTPRC